MAIAIVTLDKETASTNYGVKLIKFGNNNILLVKFVIILRSINFQKNAEFVKKLFTKHVMKT